MRRHLLWPLSLSLLLSPADAQKAVPTTTYTLHAQKEQHSSNLPSTLLYLLPDQALLVLIPQQDGKWFFKRITAWDTGSPKEETIGFTGEPHQEGASGEEELKVDPSNTYAVIRIKSFTGNIHSVVENQSAVIVLIDLRSFTLISQSTTNDPLLATSSWSFAENGLLIARTRTDSSTVKPPHPKYSFSFETMTDTYQAAALTLPGFKPSMPCQYELFLDDREGSQRRDRYLSKVSDGCVALVALAHVPSAQNLPGGVSQSVPNAQLARYAQLAGPTCQISGESSSADYALYGCRTGHGYMDDMIITTNSRNLTVLSVPDGKPVLTVPLPHNLTPYPALLPKAVGHTWLLFLRDGIKLETYRLP